MKRSSFIQFIVLSITIIIILILIIVATKAIIIYKDDLPFDRSRFLNDIFGFILDILALFIAFELGQVFWERQKKVEQKHDVHHSLIMYLGKLGEIAHHLESLVLLSEKQRINDDLKQDYHETLMKITLWGDSFFIFFKDIELVDQQFINHYIDNIFPVISRLSKMDVLWGNQEWLKNAIAQLRDNIHLMKSIKMS
jgi:hypothetical protein